MTAPAGKSRRRKRKIALTVLLVLLLGGLAAAAYTYWRTDQALSTIKRDDKLLSPQRQAEKPVDPAAGKPINYLLLGSDTRGQGDQGRSDSLMVVHLPADRRSAYLVSLPRDSYVKIPGYEAKRKINAAYELGGPQLTTATVEDLLGVKVNHVALVDFGGFINLVQALGGVTIDNPHGGCDTSQKVCWKKGVQELNSERALQYVRWRHGLPNGDLDRAGNQQRVVKAIVAKALSAGTLTDPGKLNNVITGAGRNVTVDSTLTNDLLRATALNLRFTSSSAVKEVTLPISNYATIDPWGSVDLLDKAKVAELRQALAQDTMEAYYLKHRNDPVAGVATVTKKP